MKKLFSLILAILCLSLPLVSCSNEQESDVPAGMARAKNAAMDLWVFYPENWTVAENGEQLKLVSAEQNSLENQMSAEDLTDAGAVLPSNIANVSITRLAEDVEDLKAYSTQAWGRFDAHFVFDAAVEEKNLGADDTITRTYHYASVEGKVLYRFSQTFVLHAGTVYAVTFTATDSLFELLSESAKEIRKSLTFEKVEEADNTPLSAAADETVEEDEARVPAKDGLVALTNAGVEYILYYPASSGFATAVSSGFLALRHTDGATVSVVRGDAFAAQIQTPAAYLDTQYYPSFDALYGKHTETAREQVKRDDCALLTVRYDATVDGEAYSFYHALYMRQGYIYTLLYTAKAADFDTHFSAVQTMVSEFEFKA